MGKIYLVLVFLFLISFVSATITCDTNSFSATYQSIPTGDIIITTNCHNTGNNSVNYDKIGSFFSLVGGASSIGANETKSSLKINIVPTILNGDYNGYVYFGDGSSPIIISITIESQQTTGCRLIELPHTTNYRIKQGETGMSSQIKLKVSTDCPDALAMSVTEQTQMSKPMYLQGTSGDIEPGGEFSFTIGLDAQGVSTGTYQNTYTVIGTLGDEIYQKSITLFTVVAVGDSPLSNETFSSLPTCTMSSDMQLNKTYSMVCNSENPNINIEVPYNDFFEGVGVSESEGKFEYKVKPLKIGVTNFLALFKYKGVSIGAPFLKEIRVMAGDVPIQGTQLKILLYQLGIKKELSNIVAGDLTILVKDSNTDSVVNSFKVYLNGQEVGNQNNNTVSLDSEKDYELIISSPGYISNTSNFTTQKLKLQIMLEPSKSFYLVGDDVNLTTNVNGSLFTIDGYVANSPYTFTEDRNYTIMASKQGYVSDEINVTVKAKIKYNSMTPTPDDWGRGDKVKIQLNENVSNWQVFVGGVELTSGTGDMIEFKTSKAGYYEIKADGIYVLTKQIEGESKWYNPFSWNWVRNIGYWWVVIVCLMGFLFWLIFIKNTESEEATHWEK